MYLYNTIQKNCLTSVLCLSYVYNFILCVGWIYKWGLYLLIGFGVSLCLSIRVGLHPWKWLCSELSACTYMCVCTRIRLFNLACYALLLLPDHCNKCVEVDSMQEVWVTGQTKPKHHQLWSIQNNRLCRECSFCLSLLTVCRWQWGSLYWPYTAAKS